MKRLFLTLTTITSLTFLGLTGCSKSDSGGPVLDTSKLQSAFSTASAVDKAEVDKAISAIKSGDFASAATALKQAAANVKITPEQQQAIKDLLAQVQAKLGAAAGGAVDATKKAGEDAAQAVKEGAGKAASDLQKAVGK